MTTSLNGWPYPAAKGLKTFDVPGTNRRITADPDAGRILVAIAADYHATVRPIDVGVWDEGAYADRDARGATGRKSNHSNGTAIDINYSEEGAMASSWGKKFFANVKHRKAINEIKARYGSVTQWGGDWNARDFMHWEIKPGTTREEVLALCEELGINAKGVRTPPKPKPALPTKPVPPVAPTPKPPVVVTPTPTPVPTPPKPQPPVAKPSKPVIRLSQVQPTKSNASVAIVQEALRKEVGLAKTAKVGTFDSLTKTAYAKWQKKLKFAGSDADGVPGIESLRELGKRQGFSVRSQ